MNSLEQKLKQIEGEPIVWKETPARRIYISESDGRELFFRLNDFPDEPICAIIGYGDAIELEHMPDIWELDRAVVAENTILADKFKKWSGENVVWLPTSSKFFAKATIDGNEVFFRMNEWPEPKCTLLGLGEALDFEELPSGWGA